jgi:predicted DsbA family dithiol-disulfide isomerase
MQERLATIGRAEGIAFAPGGRTGNTRDSHRLIQLGKTKGEAVQTRVVEELFKGYFEEERDITSKAFLKAAGVQAGLDGAEVTTWLDGDAGGADVDREVEKAARFVNGVPNFTIQGRFHVDGAQDPEEFLRIFDAVARQED